MFNWDGSNITDFILNENIIIEEGKYNKKTYWKIIKDNVYEICLVKTSTNTFPCLIDELKIAFDLEKIGTHWIKFKSKIMILKKLEIWGNIVLEELTLNKIKFNKYLEAEVQKIFIFRELLGMTANFEKNIILRNKGLYIKPISFNDNNMAPYSEGKVIPETIINKWFKNSSLNEAILKMFGTKNINFVLLKLKSELEKICLRVNKDLIINIDEILTRIRSRMQFIVD